MNGCFRSSCRGPARPLLQRYPLGYKELSDQVFVIFGIEASHLDQVFIPAPGSRLPLTLTPVGYLGDPAWCGQR